MPFKRHLVLFELPLCFCVILCVAWIARGKQHAIPIYDPATVVTVSGSVQTVEQHLCSLGWGNASSQAQPESWLGTHVMLMTNYGILDAHLGPSSFLKDHDFNLEKGDEIEVTGSKFAGKLPVIMIAKELKKGQRFLELRDRDGQPMWYSRISAESQR